MTAFSEGKVVIANPECVAQADQIAAAHDVNQVQLSKNVPLTHVYIVDLDFLKLPDRIWRP